MFDLFLKQMALTARPVLQLEELFFYLHFMPLLNVMSRTKTFRPPSNGSRLLSHTRGNLDDVLNKGWIEMC